MQNINETIGRFYKLIEGKEGGEPDSRYKSWEWCHQFFLNNRNTEDAEIKDQMALHLAFYLASWGMYRGSSFLLQRDYKVHKKAVDVILKEKYEPLWDYSPTDKDAIEKAADLIFGKKISGNLDGAYWELKKAYQHDKNEAGCELEDGEGGGGDIPSDTLITKILMGTFGCIPAFDRFLKRGISQVFPRKSNTVCGHRITQSIDNESSGSGKETFLGLSYYCYDLKNRDAFKINNKLYPPMKCLDMYLWELGYEYELWDVLRYAEGKKDNAAFKKAKSLGFGENTDDPKKIAEEIREKNGFQEYKAASRKKFSKQ